MAATAKGNEKPAIAGGKPVFEELLPIVRPALASFEEVEQDVKGIIASGMLTKGKHLAALEEEAAGVLGVRHAVGVSSCTAGLMLIFKALGLEGEVIVPSFTFMASVSSIVWAGLRPVFAEVREETTNLDPAAAEAAITPRTCAMVAVHNFGNPAEIDALEKIAEKHGLALVFDAAHGFGTMYNGRPVGGSGKAESFSMSPTKLVIAGEGGIVTTNDDELARRVRVGREYGNSGGYDTEFPGLNARLAEVNALLARRSLTAVEEAASHRNRLADLMRNRLGGLPGISFQHVRPQDRCSYKDFSIFVDGERFGMGRDRLAESLRAENVDTRKYYDPPAHLHTAYARYSGGAHLPVTDRLSGRALSLPIHSRMSTETAEKVCHAVERIYRNGDRGT